jgi:hypothetical protein
MSGVSARVGVLGALAVLAVTIGCLPPYEYYFTENYAQLLTEPLAKAPRPLAREIHYTLVHKVEVSGAPNATLAYADRQTQQQVYSGTFSVPKPSRSGSEVLQGRADEARAAATRSSDAASRQAHRDRAVVYSRTSEAALRTEMATGQVMAAAGVLDASVGLLSAMGSAAAGYMQNLVAQHVQRVQESTGAVGPDAPSGTVLYLQFHIRTEGEFWGHVTSVLVSATLDRGPGQVFRSDRQLSFKFVRPKPPEGTPPPSGFPVPFTGQPVPVNDLAFDTMVPMAQSAIAELYLQQPGE